MSARIPYLNEWTVDYALKSSSGVLIQPSTITCAITNANGSAVTLTSGPSWDASTNTTIQTFANTEVSSSAYATRWTLTWAGTASGTDFTDVESLVVVAPGEEYWHTTVCEVKELLGVTDSTDDEDISYLIASAQDTLETAYGLPTVPKVTEQRKFNCTNRLILTDELVSVTEVYDHDGDAISSSAYHILYGRRPDDLYRGILLDDAYDEMISVSGTWGYDNTPSDVLRALTTTVSTWYKRMTLGSDADVIGGFSTLPREAKDLMESRRSLTL